MKEVQGYKCDFCGKIYQRKNFCARHEIACNRNPINFRACFGCSFCKQQETVIYFDSPLGGELSEKRKLLFCSKTETYVYPPKVERNSFGYGYELGDVANEPMPKECDFRVDILDLRMDIYG